MDQRKKTTLKTFIFGYLSERFDVNGRVVNLLDAHTKVWTRWSWICVDVAEHIEQLL
jgi:hypothetical protein